MENASLLTIPQLSYRQLHAAVQDWLLGLNPRSVWIHIPLIAAFVAGVLWTRGPATCSAIAMGGLFSHDALNRLLIGPSLRALLQLVALTMVDKLSGYLVVDDVVLDKSGPLIEGIAWLHSSTLDKKVRALNLVVMGWTNGSVFIPLTFRTWKPPLTRSKKGQPSKEAYDGTIFKTKLELAVEMLSWAKQRGFQPTAVLFDAYYLAAPVLRFLKRVNWHWVSRTKANRNFKRDNKTFKAKSWVSMAAQGKAPRPSRSVTAHLSSWGEVRIIAVRHKADKDFRYLVGSNPQWGRGVIENLYGRRWAIECLFRSAKQLAGLNDCQCRSALGQENHVVLVFIAHLFLVRQSRRGASAGATLAQLNQQPIRVENHQTPAKVRRVRREQRRCGKGGDGGSVSACRA